MKQKCTSIEIQLSCTCLTAIIHSYTILCFTLHNYGVYDTFTFIQFDIVKNLFITLGGGNMRGPSMNYPRPGDQYAQKSGAMPGAMYNNHPYVSNSNTMQPTNKKHPPGYLGYNSVMSTATTGQMDPSTMPSNMDSWNGGNNMYNTNPTQMPYNNPRGLQPGIAGGMQPAMGMPMQQGQLMPGQAISDAQGSMMSYGAAPNSHQQHYWGKEILYLYTCAG